MLKRIVFLLFVVLFFISCKKEKVIKIPLVTWGGYACLFAANNGASPNSDSLFYKYGKFKVELVQVEDPALHLQGFSNGTYDIIWSTMDMLPLQYDSLSKDPSTVPVVIGAFDFSNGGDGIIVRNNIKSAKDMIKKKVVLPQYQPSHYYFLDYLERNGIKFSDLNFIYSEDAIKAKDSFINDKSIDICVTWSPFIYDITDKNKPTYEPGSSLIETTKVGSPSHGVIADVYVARNSLVSNNPEIIDAFTKAMLDGYKIFLSDKEKIADQIAKFFGIPGGKDEVMAMFEDVIICGPEENKKFFNRDEKYSAYWILDRSTKLYKMDGKLENSFSIEADKVINGNFMLKNIK